MAHQRYRRFVWAINKGWLDKISELATASGLTDIAATRILLRQGLNQLKTMEKSEIMWITGRTNPGPKKRVCWDIPVKLAEEILVMADRYDVADVQMVRSVLRYGLHKAEKDTRMLERDLAKAGGA